MFDTLTSTRSALECLASGFEPATLTGEQAVRVVAELGLIRRLTDGMLGRAARRVEETSAHAATGARDAAHLYARAVGADPTEARRAIMTAKRLERLPETAAAVQDGRLSARQAELVADAATHNPGAEGALLEAAACRPPVQDVDRRRWDGRRALPARVARGVCSRRVREPDARQRRER
jgi:hypothetical protein